MYNRIGEPCRRYWHAGLRIHLLLFNFNDAPRYEGVLLCVPEGFAGWISGQQGDGGASGGGASTADCREVLHGAVSERVRRVRESEGRGTASAMRQLLL